MLNQIVAIVVSLIAIAVSVFNLSVTRKQLYTNAISNNRMDWIVKVRELIWTFIDLYLKEDVAHSQLVSVKLHIDLFLNPNENLRHSELSDVLQEYLDRRDLDPKRLIDVSRLVLKERWERIKLETAYSKKHLGRINARIKEILPDAAKKN